MRFLLAFALAAALPAGHAGAQSQRAADSVAITIAAGRAQWLRYDTEAHQVAGCDSIPPTLDELQLPTLVAMKVMHNAVANCATRGSNAGSSSYDRAEALFRAAHALAPGDVRAFRQLAMLLADRDRWKELELLSRDMARRHPVEGWGWLGLGLALHRGGASRDAAAAFDSALSRLDAPERARMFAFQRLLARPDSIAYSRSSPGNRAAMERTLWAMADPLWSRAERDPRTEFLARVTYAELRWTVDESRVRGADSDRGETYIRFGPPDLIIAKRGSAFSGTPIQDAARFNDRFRQDPGRALAPRPSDVVTWWDYFGGLSVVFWGAPTYGTANLPAVDGVHFEQALEERPAAFDNIAAERILAMPVRAMRFRADGDSVDLLVIAQAPMGAIRGPSAANAPVRADFWLAGRETTIEYHDSLSVRPSGIEQRTFRVAPGAYHYRVEATAEGSMTAGRAMAWVAVEPDAATGFAIRGFGSSDLLLASIAQPQRTPPSRWTDFNIAPLLGALPRQQNLELIWETYEPGVRDGQARYQVSLTLQRQRSATGRVAAAILGFAAGAVGIDRKDDRVTFTFERALPAARVVAEHVSIAMADTPAGEYRITLEVTDRVTGRKTSRFAQIQIGP